MKKIGANLFLLLGFLAAGLAIKTLPTLASPLGTLGSDDIVAGVNALRASKGLPSLQANAALMSAAQTQSDYQASIGVSSHAGPDGSNAVQRDMAAGYGGGAKIFTSENVASLNPSATLNTLIYSIWADSIHWATMVNPNATDCGVGVAVKDGTVYYTLDVSYLAGGQAGDNGTPNPTDTPGAETTATSPVSGPTATSARFVPVQTATAMDDGRIVHVVQRGQALVSIALAYGVKVADIRALNGIAASNNTVYVGQKLLIRAANTLTPSPTPSDTLPPPTRTLAPSNTPGPPPPSLTPSRTLTQTPLALLPKMSALQDNPRQSIGTILVVVCGLGLAGVLISNLLRKK